MADQTFGKYRATRRLGHGGMAEVYEGIHPALERRVAIKVMLPQLAETPGFDERFRREARLVATLRHPHIVRLYDFDIEEGRPYMVMEFLAGGDLAGRLRAARDQGQTLPLGECARVLDAVSGALDYAHERGAIHRDIKPGNILFTESGEPVLSDFGIAKLLQESASLTMTGGVVGSPAYMSPEQARGEAVDARSDVYALGVVLFEMAAGRVPFAGTSPTAVLLKHVQEPPASPRTFNPNLPPAVDAVILRALAKDPAARYQSAGALARAFGEALGLAPQPGLPVSEDAPTVVAAETAPASAGAPPLAQGSDSVPASATDEPISTGWFTRALNAANVLAPIVGYERQEQPRDAGRRARLMSALGALAVILALLQFLADLFDLFAVSGERWAQILPYLLVVSLAAVVVVSVQTLRRSSSTRQRVLALALLAFTLLLAVGWGGWTAFQRLRPPEGYVIAIADFDGAQASIRRDFARRFQQSLEAEFQAVEADVEIVLTGEVYEDSAQARARGRELKAAMVIWGWYDDSGVGPRIELLQLPALAGDEAISQLLLSSASAAMGLGKRAAANPLSTELVNYVHVPATVPSLEFAADLGDDELGYVATTAVGLALYAEGQYAEAVKLLDRALSQGGEFGASILGRDLPHFYRAVALYALDRQDEAVPDLEAAIAANPDLFEGHYNLALAYAEVCAPTRRPQLALIEAEKAVRLRPEDAPARLLQGELLLARERPEEAVEALAIGAGAAPQDARMQQLLGDAYTASGQAEEARRAYQRAQELAATAGAEEEDPYGQRIQEGDLAMLLGDYEVALAAYQAAAALQPEQPAAQQGIGNAHYWSGDYEEALAAYEKAAALDPGSAGIRLQQGLASIALGDHEGAIVVLQEAARLSDCDPAPYLLLGGELVELEDYAAAVEAYEQALTYDPEDVDARTVLASARWLSGDSAGAISAAEAVLAEEPDSTLAARVLAQAASAEGDYERAAGAWERLVSLQPQDGDAWSLLGDAYFQLGETEAAAEAYEQALALREDAADLGSAALARALLGETGIAEEDALRAIALNGDSSSAYQALGFVYKQQGDYAQAAEAYERALALEESANAYRLLGEVYGLLGRIDDAVSAYENAARLAPADYQTFLQLGRLYARQNDLEAAENTFSQALAVDEEGHEAQFGLADAAYRRCNLSTASQAARRAADLAPENSYYRVFLAAIYEAQGRTADAAAIYESFAAAEDGDVVSQLARADYRLRQGELDAAAKDLERLLEQPDLAATLAPYVRVQLADIYYAQDRLLPAQGEYELALQGQPLLPGARAALGDIALRQGDVAAALAAYGQALDLLPQYSTLIALDQATALEIGVYLRQALAYEHRGESEQAGETRDTALARAQALAAALPRAPLSHFVLAIVRQERGEQEQAGEALALAEQCDQSLAQQYQRTIALLDLLRPQ